MTEKRLCRKTCNYGSVSNISVYVFYVSGFGVRDSESKEMRQVKMTESSGTENYKCTDFRQDSREQT